MKIGIICAMEEEIRTLLTKLDSDQVTEVAGNTFHQGQIGKQEVTLVQSGIGKVQAAMTTAIMLDRWDLDVVINTGSAGGIGQGLHIGDVVISDGVGYHDVDVTGSGYLPGQLPGQPQIFTADPHFVAEIAAAAKEVGLPAHVGLIVSGDQFIAGAAESQKILKCYPQALASEMEGAAIGQVATQFKVPFVVIRAMSDVGDADAEVNFDDFVVEAGKKSAAMVLAFLKQADHE
ncbi:MTA SAH nucleosidase [Lactobacillus selangorensis]|uniref:adenosylhomocysteine nucleosidase n=1 Tax=Lactobacillus selangorensis TaxID=81857 RepID=A0A0R2G0M4_9LACO|nr:5'-methylthioadenosine/adenosylhomocysteine nucleosidase [Lactobacillus selangorensis]KRN29375.1 MTA SAH nucleosidase [Lactobacillus selangorensis]KRN34096.1 MTA SAH nucleosidase [Lactobacillus selangorensis]